MKNKDSLHVSRRRFLAQLGGLTVAGMLGPSLLTPRSARAADERMPLRQAPRRKRVSLPVLTGGRFAPRWLTVDLWRQNRLNRINTRPK